MPLMEIMACLLPVNLIQQIMVTMDSKQDLASELPMGLERLLQITLSCLNPN